MNIIRLAMIGAVLGGSVLASAAGPAVSGYVLWRNATATGPLRLSSIGPSGQIMSTTNYTNYAGYQTAGVLGPSFTLGAGDLDANGVCDVVIAAPAGLPALSNLPGVYYVRYNATGTIAGYTRLRTTNITNFKAVGTADFDGDGIGEVVYRNNATLELRALETNGTAAGTNEFTLGVTAFGSYNEPVGVGDFDGDGESDVLFRNPSTGQFTPVLYSSGVPIGVYLPLLSTKNDSNGAPNRELHRFMGNVHGSFDVNADGISDVIASPTDNPNPSFNDIGRWWQITAPTAAPYAGHLVIGTNLAINEVTSPTIPGRVRFILAVSPSSF